MYISDGSTFTDTKHEPKKKKERKNSPPYFHKEESNYSSFPSFNFLKWLQALSLGSCMHTISGIRFPRIQTEPNQDTGIYLCFLMPRDNQECASYFLKTL